MASTEAEFVGDGDLEMKILTFSLETWDVPAEATEVGEYHK